jgi:hypothetical protein
MFATLLPHAPRLARRCSTVRGVTRFELMLALGGLGVLGALLSFWQLGDGGLTANHEAEKRGKVVLSAAADWKREHARTGCPSITQLRRDDVLDVSARAEDPWGKRFRILCTSGEIQVRSAGGDGLFETSDDITLAAAPNT